MEEKTFLQKLGNGIDYFFNKLLPKKAIVITVATVMVFKQIDVPTEYWYILMAYFGVNVAGKFAGVLGGSDRSGDK